MSEEQQGPTGLDDLLKNAIPIDQVSDDELDIEEADGAEEAEDQSGDARSGYKVEMAPTVEMSEEVEGGSKRRVESLADKVARKEMWTREVDRTSHGASHVRTFIGKMNKEAIAYMDEQINTWLAENPDTMVKFVTVAQGDIIGRTRDPSLLVSVWV